MFFYYFLPQPILVRIGPSAISWYGLLIFFAFWAGFFLTLKLAKYQGIKKTTIVDLVFWLFIFGIFGARLYHVFLEINYYWQHPLEILFFWRGGLGIFGAMIFGFLVLYFYSRKHQLNFLTLLDLFSPALTLGIAIIRWGNYFNQEIYGLPSHSFFRIPIALENRLPGFENFEFFHPLFFYESFFCFSVFLFLIFQIKKRPQPGSVIFFFLFFYSIFRFFIEFLRIDPQPLFFGLRLGQVMSLGGLVFSIFILIIIEKRARRDLNPRSSP